MEHEDFAAGSTIRHSSPVLDFCCLRTKIVFHLRFKLGLPLSLARIGPDSSPRLPDHLVIEHRIVAQQQRVPTMSRHQNGNSKHGPISD